MQFLNKEIEALVKRKKSKSLVKKQISCGIFQDLEDDKHASQNHQTIQ
ncbi:MAG: hypothetical protein AAF348_07680 [Bacteroidota bacterium]